MSNTHPTAIIEKGAKLSANVKIGPYCVVGKHVVLEEGVELLSHVVVMGRTTIGFNTIVYPFASIGHAPQDLKYQGELSELIIGSHNRIREHVTIQPGTLGGGMKTVIGDHCLLMVGVHVAHDCSIGNHVVMANNATLAGHVVIEDHVIVGGLSAVRQFVRIGSHAIIGGMSGVEKDVIPYGLVMGERASLHGLNLVGLKRHNFNPETIQILQKVYATIFSQESGSLMDRVEQLKQEYKDPAVSYLLSFLSEESKVRFCMPKQLNS